MRLIELLARVHDLTPTRIKYAQALGVVLRRWPTVKYFTDEQLTALRAELRKKAA